MVPPCCPGNLRKYVTWRKIQPGVRKPSRKSGGKFAGSVSPEFTGKQETLQARETSSEGMEAPRELRTHVLSSHVLELVLSPFARSHTVLQAPLSNC